MQNTEPANADSPYNDGYFFLALLLKHKKFIFIATIIATVTSVVVALYLPNIYTATVSAVPPRKSSSTLDAAMSNVSSTLREFGMTKVGGKKGESYDFIVLLQSRQVKDSLINKFELTKVYEIPDTARFAILDELEGNLTFNIEPEGNYTVTVDDKDPKRAADMANYIIAIANILSQQLDRREGEVLYKQFGDRIEANDRQISELKDTLAKYTRQTLVYSPLDQAKAAAQSLGELKGEVMKQEIALSIIQHSYGADDPVTIQQQEIINELRGKVFHAENRPGFLGNFSLSDAPSAAIPYLRLYAQLEALIKLKAFLVPSFEQVKLDRTKESPSLYVLDDAHPPQKKSRPKRSILVLSSTAGAFFLSCLYVLLSFHFGKVRKRYIELKNAEQLS